MLKPIVAHNQYALKQQQLSYNVSVVLYTNCKVCLCWKFAAFFHSGFLEKHIPGYGVIEVCAWFYLNWLCFQSSVKVWLHTYIYPPISMNIFLKKATLKKKLRTFSINRPAGCYNHCSVFLLSLQSSCDNTFVLAFAYISQFHRNESKYAK